MLPGMVSANHEPHLRFTFKYYVKFKLGSQGTFPVLVELVATVLGTIDTGQLHHHRTSCWTVAGGGIG